MRLRRSTRSCGLLLRRSHGLFVKRVGHRPVSREARSVTVATSVNEPESQGAGFLWALHNGHKLMADGTLDPARCLAERDLDIEQQPMRCVLDAGHDGFHEAGRGPWIGGLGLVASRNTDPWATWRECWPFIGGAVVGALAGWSAVVLFAVLTAALVGLAVVARRRGWRI